eukprot:SAG25_NODE_1128_length_3866_cov_7.922485_3_plen_60_part_00
MSKDECANGKVAVTLLFFICRHFFKIDIITRRDTRMGQLAGARARAAMHFSLRRPHNMI